MAKKIALLIHALHGGGAERLMSQLATRWAIENEVHLITWAAQSTDAYFLPENVQRHGLDLMCNSSGIMQAATSNIRRVTRLRKLLHDIEPDWLLSFCDQMNIVALQASRHLSCPRWIAEHSNPEKQKLSRLWEYWRGWSYPGCTGCVVLTEGIAEYMQRWISRERIHIIPPAIQSQQVDLLAKSPSDSDAERRWQPENKHLLYVGRLSSEKRVDVLLAAWQQIQAELVDWELIIVGDGPQRSRLEAQAEQLPRIQFMGWQQDPSTYYRQAQVFVLTSAYEGFPVALLEAMSHGLACVSSENSDALCQLNQRGTAVLTVPVDDAAALALTLKNLAADSQLRQQLASQALATSRYYQWSEIGKKWDAILESNPNRN